MPHRIQPEKRVDRNELDSQSYQIATYFTMSNYEIIRLRTTYNYFIGQSVNDPTPLSIVKYCSFTKLPILVHISELRENVPYSWNSFFQFITFTALAPTVCSLFFCMCMVLDIGDDNANISLDDIHKFCDYFNTAELYDEANCRVIFNEIDTNNDGFISIQQFFTFVSKTNELWMPICDFRLSLIDHFFPHDLAVNILQRRAHIHIIREYKMTHNGAYPDLTCKDQIYEIFFGIPNKYVFDYDPNENISIYDITRMMIMKYKKDKYLVNDHKILCSKKQIPKIIDSPRIQQLDRIYTTIGGNAFKQCGGGGGGDNESRNNSRTSILSQQQKGLNNRPHSILKPTSSYHQLHTAKSTKKTTSCECFDFNGNKAIKKPLRSYKSANQTADHVSPISPISCLELPGYVAQ